MNANTLFKSSSTWARARDFRYFPFQYFKCESYGKMQMVVRKDLLGKQYTVLVLNKTANIYLYKLKLKQKLLMKCDIRLKIKQIMLEALQPFCELKKISDSAQMRNHPQ